MKRTVLLISAAWVVLAQPYTIATFAGGAPPPTPGPAVKAAVYPAFGFAAAGGNVYFSASNCVFKVDANGILTRVAGNSRWGTSAEGGPAGSAEFSSVGAVALDHAGNIYVADGNTASGLVDDNVVRKITPDGTIRTVVIGLDTGPSQISVRFAVDRNDNLYIVDGSYILKLSTDGNVTTVAGTGSDIFSGDGGLAINAGLGLPGAIAVDGSGNLYVAAYEYDSAEDFYDHSRVRVITPDGKIKACAGTGVNGDSGDGGPATAAQIGYVYGLAVDGSGNVLIADISSHKIRKVTPDGIITSLQTQDQSGCFLQGSGPYICANDVTVDAAGRIYILGSFNRLVQMLGTDGKLTTVAGGGPGNFGDGGPATSAPLSNPLGIAVDSSHNLYIADASHNRIRKVAADGTITTVAGNGAGRGPGDAPVGDGGSALDAPLACATTATCKGVAADGAGNFFFADGNSVRKVSAAGIITTVTTLSRFNSPSGAGGLASDGKNVYIADTLGAQILKLAPDGTLTPVAGSGSFGHSGDGSLATGAAVNFPVDVAVDGAGNLYIAEIYPGRVRKVSTSGIITTIAGNGTPGFSGDGGLAINAQLATNLGLTADAAGNVYIADYDNNRVRKVSTDGTIATIAGGSCRPSPFNPCQGYIGDGGPGTSAQLWGPARLAVDSDGSVYFSDVGNNAIRVLRPVH